MGPPEGDRPAAQRSAEPRVLIVDDSRLGRKLAAILLAQAGFQVEEASTPAEALGLVSRTVPDAVLSDVRMPGMSGFELCRALRGDPRLGRVPVVLLTADVAGEDDQNQAREAGSAAIVPRSPDLREAIDALAEALKGRR